MRTRTLGRTGLDVSEIAMGCGITAGTFVAGMPDEQERLLAAALAAGITMFDTAPLYGDGRSEQALGRALRTLGARPIVTTKVRLDPGDLADPAAAVERSVVASLERLQLDSVDVLTLHNRVDLVRTDARDVGVDDVLRGDGIAAAMAKVKEQGLTRNIGFTAIGRTAAMKQIIESDVFDTCQLCVNLLNPSAVRPVPSGFRHADYDQVAQSAAVRGMGVLAVRVLSGGAFGPATEVSGLPPMVAAEAEADRVRAAAFGSLHRDGRTPAQTAIRFPLAHECIAAAIVGLSTIDQVEEAAACSDGTALDANALEQIDALHASVHL